MLSGKQKHYLRGLAHERKPVVAVGSAGLSEAVGREIETALAYHELIKIKLPAIPRADRASLIQRICDQTAAQSVQLVGRIGVIYRAKDEPLIHFPD